MPWASAPSLVCLTRLAAHHPLLGVLQLLETQGGSEAGGVGCCAEGTGPVGSEEGPNSAQAGSLEEVRSELGLKQ